MTTHPLLSLAIDHHQANRLDQAEGLYRHILSTEPDHADALHLLGVVAHQKGQPAQAIELIERAVRLNPETAVYHMNLAEAYRVTGDSARAVEHGRSAARLQPANADIHNNLGLALQAQGIVEEAIAHYEAALERKPHWPAPYLNLGNLLGDEGRRYEALAVYREGIRLCGEAPRLHDRIGQLLLEMGQADDALVHCQEAVRLRPKQPEALTHLANVLAALGRRDEARTCYTQAIQLAPTLAEPYDRLGLLLQAEGKLDEALTWLRQALQLEPQNAKFHCHLAGVLYDQEQGDEAVAAFRQALKHQPQDFETHNYLGYVLQDQGDVQGALAAYREAVRLKPDYADAFLNMGILLSEMGELEQALTAYREALRHDPRHPEALAALALALRTQFPPEYQAAGERLLAQGRVPGQRRAVLEYGLAQVMDARGLFGRAAELARHANSYFIAAAQQRGQPYDPIEHHLYVDQIIRAYSRAHFERVRGWGLESDVPVFILGLPRSGTSLAEQILASHPQVFGAGELIFMRSAYRSIPALVGKQAPGVECIDRLDRAAVQTLAGQYLERLRRLAPQAPRIVDKMPDNYLMLGLIATLFPRARIIHTRRDVRDVGLSCWMTHFKHIRWACDLEHIGTRIREYLRLMEHWRQVLPVQLLEIDYEDIVADLEPAARRLVAWCGLEWDPACLAFHQNKRVVRTASMNQVREPLYRRSLQRWKSYQDGLTPLLKILTPQDLG